MAISAKIARSPALDTDAAMKAAENTPSGTARIQLRNRS